MLVLADVEQRDEMHVLEIQALLDAAQFDVDVAKNPLIFPTAEMLSNTFGFKNLEPQEELEFNKLFQDLVGA